MQIVLSRVAKNDKKITEKKKHIVKTPLLNYLIKTYVLKTWIWIMFNKCSGV